MSGWIKLDKKLTDSIRFRRVVRKVRDSNALRSVTEDNVTVSDEFYVTLALGALVRLWVYADTHIDNDNTLDMTLDEIDELVGVHGFGDALPADWLQVLDSNRVQLPDFLAHNGSSEKLRRDNARRQAEYRRRHESHNVTRDVTDSNARNDARPDQVRPDKTRPEKEPTAAARPAKPVEPEFAEFRAIYPERNGNQPWNRAKRAITARMMDGHTWAEILDGARRYAEWCKATGKLNTETVMQAATFCGPDKPFLKPWTPPAGKAEVRLVSNLDAAAEAKHRLFGNGGAT